MTDTKIIEDKTQQAIYLREAAQRVKKAGLIAYSRHFGGKVCALGAFEPAGQSGYAEEICPLTLLALATHINPARLYSQSCKSEIIASWSNEIAVRTTPEEGAEKVASKMLEVAAKLEAEASQGA